MTRHPAGLQLRPTFDELVDYIERGPAKIKYPDRNAQFLRNSIQISSIDGLGALEVEQRQLEQMRNQAVVNELKKWGLLLLWHVVSQQKSIVQVEYQMLYQVRLNQTNPLLAIVVITLLVLA